MRVDRAVDSVATVQSGVPYATGSDFCTDERMVDGFCSDECSTIADDIGCGRGAASRSTVRASTTDAWAGAVNMGSGVVVVIGAAASLCVTSSISPIAARADAVAYLINVTVRPGYNFGNADMALDYGHAICGRVGAGQSYREVVIGVESDFNNPDAYQASYLITQAVNELCPSLIWQLRNSAAATNPR